MNLSEGFFYKEDGSALRSESEITRDGTYFDSDKLERDRYRESFMFPVTRKMIKEKESEWAEKEALEKKIRENKMIEQAAKDIREAPLNHFPEIDRSGEKPSPNALETLFGPTVQYACNLVKKPPKVAKPLHSKDWNSSTVVPQSRKPVRCHPGTNPSVTLAQSTEDQLVEKRDPKRPQNKTNKKKSMQDTLSNPVELASYDIPGLERDIIKAIVQREELILHLRKCILIESTRDASTYRDPLRFLEILNTLDDVQRAGLKVIEFLTRRHRSKYYMPGKEPYKIEKPLECACGYVTEWIHPYEPIDYQYKGSNYLIKMTSDLNFVQTLIGDDEQCRSMFVEKIRLETMLRNPLALPLSLDTLIQVVKCTDYANHCMESSIWDAIAFITPDQIRLYRAALVVLNEERCLGMNHFSELQPISIEQSRVTFDEIPSAEILMDKDSPSEESREILFLEDTSHHVPVMHEMVENVMQLERQRATDAEMERTKRSEEIRSWLSQAEESSITLQCSWRSCVARRKTQALRAQRSSRNIQIWYRRTMRQRNIRRNICARMIQCLVRAKQAQALLKELKIQKQRSDASLKIQCAVRVMLAQRCADHIRAHNASIIIQRCTRKFLSIQKRVRFTIAVTMQRMVRGFLVRCKCTRMRREYNAAVRIQRWYTAAHVHISRSVINKLRQWRLEHTHVSFSHPFDTTTYIDFTKECSLYDFHAILLRYRKRYEKSLHGRLALAKVKEELQSRKESATSNLPDIVIFALKKVEATYIHLLRVHRHLSNEEIEQRLLVVNRLLRSTTVKIEDVERLVRLRAELEFLEQKAVAAIPKTVASRINRRLNIDLFEEDYAKLQQSKKQTFLIRSTIEKLRGQENRLLSQWDWLIPVKCLRFLEDRFNELVKDRDNIAKQCANQLKESMRGKLLRKAAVRIAHQRKNRTMESLQDRREAMEREDAYAQKYRGYLSADGKLLVDALKYFSMMDKENVGRIDVKLFQKLAYDLKIMISKSKANSIIQEIDLDGDGNIDFVEFCIWWLCRSADDKLKFKATFSGSALKHNIKLGTLRSSLALDKTMRNMTMRGKK